MKNVVNLLKKAIKDMRVSFVGDRIPMDPDTIRSLRSRIRMDLLPYCEGRSMIPVFGRQTVRIGSMIRTDPGSRSLGSDPGIRFRDPRTCLAQSTSFITKKRAATMESNRRPPACNSTRPSAPRHLRHGRGPTGEQYYSVLLCSPASSTNAWFWSM